MRHAAYCGTREIYDDMEMSAKSLVANGGVDKVHFLIEDEAFPRPLPGIVVCHDVSKQPYFPPDGPNMASKFTYMAMMRIALCHVLTDVGKVLSLDADTVVRSDVGELWELPMDDCYLAAVPEWDRSKDGLQYCNAGVVMYNLEKLRDGKADECIEVLNRRRFTWVEQDVASYLCQGRICEMPSKFNSNWWTDQGQGKRRAAIVHYAGIKGDDWRSKPLAKKYRRMTWDEAMELHG